jgi:hypothetical protein
MPATLPGHNRPRNRSPAWSSNHAGQPVLHVNPQRHAGCKLRPLRTTRHPFRMLLRRGGPILQAAAARGRVAPQLARDRRSPANPLVRRRPPQPAGNLPNAEALHTQDRKRLPLRKRQIPRRQRLRRWPKRRWWHAARLPEPSRPNRWRHPRAYCRILARPPRRGRRPEPSPVLTTRHPRPPRRPQLTPQGPIRTSPTRHRTTLYPRVATTS